MVKTSTEGQALELGSRRDRVLDLALMDYIALAGKKTRWYTTVAPCGWAPSSALTELRSVSRFGFLLGLAFHGLPHP